MTVKKKWAVCDGCGWEGLSWVVAHVSPRKCDCGCGKTLPKPKIVKCHYCPTCYETTLEMAVKQKKQIAHRREGRHGPAWERGYQLTEEEKRKIILFHNLMSPYRELFEDKITYEDGDKGLDSIWVNEKRYAIPKDPMDVWVDWKPDIIEPLKPVEALPPMFDEPGKEKPRSKKHLWALECPDSQCDKSESVWFVARKSDVVPCVHCSCCGARLRAR